MRKIYIAATLFVFSLFFTSCSSKINNSKFYTNPENPKVSDNVTVYYRADSTNLAKADSIDMIVYQYNDDLLATDGFAMKKEGDKWTATFEPNKDALGAIIKFRQKDIIDNNDKAGYVIHFYNKNDKPLPNTYAAFAQALLSWAPYYLEMDKNYEVAYKNFKKDFNKNSPVDGKYLSSYLDDIDFLFPDKADSVVNSTLSTLEKKSDLSEDDLGVLVTWYGNKLDTTKAADYTKEMEAKYPKSEFVQLKKYREFTKEKDFDKKFKMAQEFEIEFPESKYNENLYEVLANVYRDKKEYKKAEEFLQKYSNKVSAYRFYSVASQMISENADPKLGYEIAKMGVVKGKKEVENPSGKRLKSMTKKEYLDDRTYQLGLNLYALAYYQNKNGETEKALKNDEQAVNFTNKEDERINNLYTSLLMENKDYDKAINVIGDLIKSGNSSPEMKSELKEAYIKKNGSEKGYGEFASKFEDAAKLKLIAKLKKEKIDEPAPGFTLTDLNGKKVSLADYKGKKVILDFWATWCGPCKSSFPGMKQAVEKFKDDKSVAFLFVNTWERVQNKEKNAEDFISKNHYPFHVLVDGQNKVVEKYKVSGIPTKFIIDSKGRIRFKSIGFSGNTDSMVSEISTMISMLD